MIKDVIVQRFIQICVERKISYTELARRAGVTPSTVYSMLRPERRELSVITVKKLCDGLDMTLATFFDDPVFGDLPQEIE